MFSSCPDQDDVLHQLLFICTDPECRWKTATCVGLLTLVLTLSWLLGKWRSEVVNVASVCLSTFRDLLKCILQIEALSTTCLNDSEELLEEIAANVLTCSGRKKSNKHNACSGPSVDAESNSVSVHRETLSDQSTERDYMFSQHDPPSSKSAEVNLKSGSCVSDYSFSTTSTTVNSPSPTVCLTVSDFSLFYETSDQSSLATISMVAAPSKSGLEVKGPKHLWKRAILFVRIVVMLLPERLKQKNGTLNHGRKESLCCPDTDDGLLSSSKHSFQRKRDMFEKCFKMNESSDKLPKPLGPMAWYAGQTKTDLNQKNEQTITTSTDADGPLAAHHSKETTDTLNWSNGVQIQSIAPETSHNLDSDEDKPKPEVEEVLESSRKLVQDKETHPKPVSHSLNTLMDHQSSHCNGDGAKGITDRRPHLCVAEQLCERNDQTLRDVEPVTPAAYELSLRLELANIKGNSPQEDHYQPNSPGRTEEARKHIADGITTPGDVSAEMTDGKKCHKITQSQQQTPSAMSTPALKRQMKTVSEPDMRILSSSTEAKAQGLDMVALDLIDENVKQKCCAGHISTCRVSHRSSQVLRTNVTDQPPSLSGSEKELSLLEEANAQSPQRQIKDKLEFNVKQKMLYQLWGLPSVVQRSFDITGESSFIGKYSKNLPNRSEGDMDRTPRQKKKKWNLTKRIVKSLKNFEIPKARGLKILSRRNEIKTVNHTLETPSLKDTNQDQAMQSTSDA
ncbi:hypothetical protein ACEWY4_014720 [Coilia grayii]|uniref:Uncharacterized protein n=1 Tax=Coilia grayii TaxID=363190 RepID=A0ABD1JT64_9TELE